MIELIIKKHLEKNLKVPVFLQHQENEPGSFVLIEKTSGGFENHLDSAVFVFQSYAKSLFEAALLNKAVKRAVFSLSELNEIGRVKLNSDYNFTDVSTKRYRYQAVFDIKYKE